MADNYCNSCCTVSSNQSFSSVNGRSQAEQLGGSCSLYDLLSMTMSQKSFSHPTLKDSYEVYVWGSNNSHQLAEGSKEKIIIPTMTSSFANVQQVVLTFFILYILRGICI